MAVPPAPVMNSAMGKYTLLDGLKRSNGAGEERLFASLSTTDVHTSFTSIHPASSVPNIHKKGSFTFDQKRSSSDR